MHLPSALALSLSVETPTLTFDYLIEVAAQNLAAELLAPDITLGVNVSPSALALALSLGTSTQSWSSIILPDALVLALALNSVNVRIPYVLHRISAILKRRTADILLEKRSADAFIKRKTWEATLGR